MLDEAIYLEREFRVLNEESLFSDECAKGALTRMYRRVCTFWLG
jgi:hypothetical protein